MNSLDKTWKNRSKTEKKEHNYLILHIWNSVGIKLQVKLTILNLWTTLTQKLGFQSEKEKTMKISIEF